MAPGWEIVDRDDLFRGGVKNICPPNGMRRAGMRLTPTSGTEKYKSSNATSLTLDRESAN
jgi:hypothetical protein